MIRKILYLLIIVAIFLIYLPGPNGLVRLIKREMARRKLVSEIQDLRIKNILLRAKLRRLSSPEYRTELIKKTLSPKDR